MTLLRRPGGLWRHGHFMKLWGAQTVSQFGSEITGLALPLAAILVLDASAFEVAVLATVEFLPFLLFALPAGVWVDRTRRRPILIWADIGRAAVLLSVPIAYAFDALTLWQLYGVGFATGVLTVFFDVAYQSYLPSLVERRQLVDGNAKLEISRSTAHVGGPAIAGALIELVKAPLAILADAVSFVVSALLLLGIPPAEEDSAAPEQAERRGMRAELAEGLRYILREPHIRAIATCTATFNFFSNVVGAVILVYAVRQVGMDAGVIGLVLSLGGIGAVMGAVTATALSRRIGVGRTIVAGAMTGSATLMIPLAPEAAAAPLFTIAFAILGFGVVVYNTAGISLMQAITPNRLLGRMNASRRFVVWGTIPLGSLTGGAIAAATDLRTAIWVGAIGQSLAFLGVLLSPVRALREVPEPEPEPESDAAPDIAPAAA